MPVKKSDVKIVEIDPKKDYSLYKSLIQIFNDRTFISSFDGVYYYKLTHHTNNYEYIKCPTFDYLQNVLKGYYSLDNIKLNESIYVFDDKELTLNKCVINEINYLGELILDNGAKIEYRNLISIEALDKLLGLLEKRAKKASQLVEKKNKIFDKIEKLYKEFDQLQSNIDTYTYSIDAKIRYLLKYHNNINTKHDLKNSFKNKQDNFNSNYDRMINKFKNLFTIKRVRAEDDKPEEREEYLKTIREINSRIHAANKINKDTLPTKKS